MFTRWIREKNATTIIIVITVIFYLFQILPFSGRIIFTIGSLIPYQTFVKLQLWRLITYIFLHDPISPFHLLFNMLTLWMFGFEIEKIWGAKRFTIFYLLSGIFSGLFSFINIFSLSMRFVSIIGASGAILALLTTYAIYYPEREVLLFFILPVKIKIVIIGYAIISIFGVITPQGVVSHLTHLGGIVVALVYLKIFPLVSDKINDIIILRKERVLRKNLEKKLKREKFFAEKIDPILEKISKQGMESLSEEEKKLLKKLSTFDRMK